MSILGLKRFSLVLRGNTEDSFKERKNLHAGVKVLEINSNLMHKKTFNQKSGI